MTIAITVVIPTHDRRETVVLAVRSALEQTRAPEQVLVLADGCTDGTAAALRDLGDPRVEVLELPKGPGYGYGHRNEALRRARGEVVAWLGDDDLYLPDHLERVGAPFDSGLADLVSATACVVHEDDRLEAAVLDWGVPFHRERFLAGGSRTPSSAVAHTVAAALEVGGWRADLERWGDMDLWQRMLGAGARTIATCEPTVLNFRATGRRQAEGERAAQNAAWLARLRDPGDLAAVRAALARAVHEYNASIEARVTHSERARVSAQASGERAHEAALLARAEAVRARADAERVQATLDAIYAGGWWRLRARVLPLLRLGRGGGGGGGGGARPRRGRGRSPRENDA